MEKNDSAMYSNAAEKALYDAMMKSIAFLASPEGKEVAKVEAKKAAYVAKKCHRCSGKGDLSCFKHVCGGVCFHCNGSGLEHNA